MYSLGGSPFSSGEESEWLYETQVRKSLNKVLAALKDKPSTSEAADDVETNSDDATNVDENDDAALSRQGNRELEDLVTSAGIDDLADTHRSMELNEIIREARALISDEDGNVRKLNNPEEVEASLTIF